MRYLADVKLSVVLDGPVAVYLQIVDGIRALCVSGKLEPGMKLPSARDLAASLGVNHNTVATAYRLLQDEGWVEVSHGRGVLVEYRRRPPAPDGDTQQKDGNRLRNLVAELRGKGFNEEWIVTEVAAALGVQS